MNGEDKEPRVQQDRSYGVDHKHRNGISRDEGVDRGSEPSRGALP